MGVLDTSSPDARVVEYHGATISPGLSEGALTQPGDSGFHLCICWSVGRMDAWMRAANLQPNEANIGDLFIAAIGTVSAWRGFGQPSNRSLSMQAPSDAIEHREHSIDRQSAGTDRTDRHSQTQR